MTFTTGLTSKSPIPSALWQDDEIPAPRMLDVLAQLAHFFDELGYTKTFSSLLEEAKESGLTIDIAEWARGIEKESAVPLLELYQSWHDDNSSYPTHPVDGDDDDDSDSSDDDESSAAEKPLPSSDDDSSDEDSSDDESSDNKASKSEVAAAGAKRKRAAATSSSESSEEESESSDDDESSDSESAPPAKKAKAQVSSDDDDDDSDSDSDDDSDSSDSDSDEEMGDAAASSSEDSSDDSSSDDDSEDEPSPPPPPPKSTKTSKKSKDDKPESKSKAKAKSKDTTTPTSDHSGSQTSTTLDGEPVAPADSAGNIHPSRMGRMPAGKPSPANAKKTNVPFSRIPVDQYVDPRFASNEYVSYDYADKAHRDLIVTRGRGFTKEKNKKKRGSYHGGVIDFTPKGIKFDD